MRNLGLPSVSALALAAGAALSSCGGGLGELVAAVAFIGSAGGDWQEFVGSGAGRQRRADCGAGGNEGCFVNIGRQGGDALYDTAFDVGFNGNLPNCPSVRATGRIDGKNIDLGTCFQGAYVNINQAVSSDGQRTMFFNFTPGLGQGVWVEIQDEQRRFQFVQSTTNDDDTEVSVSGCEFSAANRPAVQVRIVKSKVQLATGPFETTVASLAVNGESGPWSGRFVGISGMRLTRGTEVLELQRRDETPATPCT